MKISIKNAARLETTLNDEIDRLTGKITDRKYFQSAKDSISATTKNIESLVEKIGMYREIRTCIRDQKRFFNEQKGINDLTSDIASLNDQLDLYNLLSEFRYPEPQSSYGNDTIRFCSGISEEDKESYYINTLKIKREIQRLKDKCQGVNSNGTIELSTDIESFLKKSGLID